MRGSVPIWFTRPKTVTHPCTNRAWRRVTTLIKTNVLLLSQTGNLVARNYVADERKMASDGAGRCALACRYSHL